MTADTKTLLLQEAETLLRTHGYAAFSYADLSERIGIRKASIHHHFPTCVNIQLEIVPEFSSR